MERNICLLFEIEIDVLIIEVFAMIYVNIQDRNGYM